MVICDSFSFFLSYGMTRLHADLQESLSHDNALALALRLMLEVFHLRFLPMDSMIQLEIQTFFCFSTNLLKEITQ
jgi:hypothetical protein